jgi:hypothetical protein
MSVIEALWPDKFTSDNIPQWQCPTCQRGLMALKGKLLNCYESASSKKENAEWLPTTVPWSKGVFTCILICNNTRCQETVALTGTYEIEEFWPIDMFSGNPQLSYTEVYTPLTSVPALHVFNLSEHIPMPVNNAIAESFKIFWLDPSSCANKIRTAIEVILTQQNISKVEVVKGKKKYLPLHKRIAMFREIYVDEGEKLEAIKWIGNEGSHGDAITKKDLIDAYDLLSHIIHRLYDTEAERLKRLSRDIVASKGPVRRPSL